MSLYVTFYPVHRSSHSAEGISPAEDKKHAVLDAPVPQNIPQLHSFLGLVNYYGKFLHKLADTLAPLYQLLWKHEPWHWGQQQERAFAKAKSQLTSTCILTHFDPDKKLVLYQVMHRPMD